MKTRLTQREYRKSIWHSENKPADLPWTKATGLTTLLEIMQYKMDQLLWIMTTIQNASERFVEKGDGGLSQEEKTKNISFFKRVLATCDDLELHTSRVFSERLISEHEIKPITGNMAAQGCNSLANMLSSELSTITFFRIQRSNIEKLEQKTPLFGMDVHNAFPSAAYDISEIGKCLALGRSTAAVFHCMKPIEVALHALAKYVGATMPTILQWGYVEGAIKAVKSTDPFVADAMPLFSSVKIAWRNPVMHVAVKYTTEEAEAIFNAVKGFMAHLATKLHE